MQSSKKTVVAAIISTVSTVLLIFLFIVVFKSEPHIPLILGCAVAGIAALCCEYKWDFLLKSMISGISQSLEAVIILLLIGVLVGVWIACGTVPTLIYYGLKIITPKLFLLISLVLCTFVSFVLGAWGTVGTVGIAFMGIGVAMGMPAPAVAGSIICGAYLGEVVSPLSDATNLTAAVVGSNSFRLMKNTVLPAGIVFAIMIPVFTVLGFKFSNTTSGTNDISLLLNSIDTGFKISPLNLLPLLFMIICIIKKLPAIPSMLVGILSGGVIAAAYQKVPVSELCVTAFSGFQSNCGNEIADSLLTAGGLMSMTPSISLIIIALAFGGIMLGSGQTEALTSPLSEKIKKQSIINTLIIFICIIMNGILPDQYLGISVPGQMFLPVYKKRNYSPEKLGQTLLCSGAVTSPIIPWNTCGLYCKSILGIGALQYLPFSLLCILLPLICIVMNLFTKNNKPSET